MPRKNKTAATVAENRDAQRRSRARRQELIADMQSRLEEYDRKGVAASIEMQRVAQAVNVQNQRLKRLLVMYGVSEPEIVQYLSSPEGDHATREEDDRIFMLEEEEPELHHPTHKGTRMDHKASDSLPAQRDVLSDTFEPSNSIIHSFDHPEPLETPCDKAAEILVELRGHADSSWARVALGCYGVGSCSVKNTEIFRLMDDID
ncbi:uncharacterized protein FIESC28_10117 [Fusarium coffeatum]|uniref:BZIP domain-containing protein n=1 Tax=Fusarium coffeatum TaxID=231269 RepID=A0A366QVK3_9HYPO|nr:uncharacterized protein FIESC28_10117 [Fusarium coffeatum]RBR08937.1 hypothetical protein FIESC28_10117 [Fusarium coffeatum]